MIKPVSFRFCNTPSLWVQASGLELNPPGSLSPWPSLPLPEIVNVMSLFPLFHSSAAPRCDRDKGAFASEGHNDLQQCLGLKTMKKKNLTTSTSTQNWVFVPMVQDLKRSFISNPLYRTAKKADWDQPLPVPFLPRSFSPRPVLKTPEKDGQEELQVISTRKL